MPSLNEIATKAPQVPADTSGSEPLPAPGEPGRKRQSKLLVLASVFLVVCALVWLGFHLKAKLERKPVTVTAAGANWRTLRLKGTTEAIHARSILVPVLSGQQVNSLTITRLAAAGAHVKKGDLLVEFDRQAQTKDFLDKQAEYNKLVDQVVQEQAKEDVARAKDETELHQGESDLKKAELEIGKLELLSRIDREKAQENLEQAKAAAQQLQETFDLKRKAARAAIRALEIQRDRTRQTMLHAKANAELMQVHAPIEGVVVRNMIWKEGPAEVQEGDQVRPGDTFMQVVDPSQMQVQVRVNQADLLNLKIGQEATVRLDAYPDMVFPGKLEHIAPIGRAGFFSDKLRSFDVVFSIQGSDPKLMPDLSAAIDVDTDKNGVASGSR